MLAIKVISRTEEIINNKSIKWLTVRACQTVDEAMFIPVVFQIKAVENWKTLNDWNWLLLPLLKQCLPLQPNCGRSEIWLAASGQFTAKQQDLVCLFVQPLQSFCGCSAWTQWYVPWRSSITTSATNNQWGVYSLFRQPACDVVSSRMNVMFSVDSGWLNFVYAVVIVFFMCLVVPRK